MNVIITIIFQNQIQLSRYDLEGGHNSQAEGDSAGKGKKENYNIEELQIH